MAEELRHRLPGWETVTPAEVALEGFSGFGGGRTYRVSRRANLEAGVAALHVLPEAWCAPLAEPVLFDRQRIAHELFAAADISPRRICDDPGKEWYVDEWVGDRIDDDASLEEVEEIARLIARVHLLDTGWYDDIRRRQRALHPTLESAGDDSLIWWYAAKPFFFEQIDERALAAWIKMGPRPATVAGARLVTTHGDVHYRNIIRTSHGLRLIDAEMASVTSAIQEIAYCWSDTLNGCLVATGERRDAFLKAYLQESRLPAAPQDVFALRLDAERCRMVTNFTDVNALWAHVSEHSQSADVGAVYPVLEAIADRALVDLKLAEDIVTVGFDQCAAVKRVQQRAGLRLPGMPVTVQTEQSGTVPMPLEINWDGTIELAHERWRALVLGIDAEGKIMLSNIENAAMRLQVRMCPGGIPVTGRTGPGSAAVAMCLTGAHAGGALVVSRIDNRGPGNSVEFVKLGEPAEALMVHFEGDGIVRLADRPHQAFDCADHRTDPGTTVLIYHNHCQDNQRFVINDDATLSPISNPDVVWGLHGDDLTLVARHDAWAQRLTFSANFAAAARAPGPSTLVENVSTAACSEGYVLELASHPGYAISVCPEDAGEVGRPLILVPAGQAERVIIGADHLRFANGAGWLALGSGATRSLKISRNQNIL